MQRPSGAPAAVEMTHARVTCHDRPLLDDLSLVVPEGVIAGLVGPNGAGKTTMLRLLGGLVPLASGSARLLGFSLPAQAGAVRGRIGLVPDRSGLYDDVRVGDHLRHAARLAWPRDPARQQEAVRKALDAFGLTDWQDRWCGTLSAGLRRRVALARATLGEPRLLLLDEVTNELDPPSRASFADWLAGYRRARPDRTVIFATHNVWEVARLCDYVIVLDQGRRLFCGPRETLVGPEAGDDAVEQAILALLIRKAAGSSGR